MKNMYNTSKEQLLLVLTYGAIMAFWAFAEAETNSRFYGLLITIIAATIFYALGWKHNKETK